MYKHEQLGYVIIGSLFAAMILVLAITPNYLQEKSIFLAALVFFCLLLFYKLSVNVDNKIVIVKFGIGLVRKKFKLAEIKSAKIVKNKWYHGWGIHYTRDGWVYNVSGYDAVEIVMKNGRKSRLGTNDPKGLHKYISGKI